MRPANADRRHGLSAKPKRSNVRTTTAPDSRGAKVESTEQELVRIPEPSRARESRLRSAGRTGVTSTLAHGAVTAMGTPRRLALRIDGLALAQPDLEEELTGPPAGAAFDKEGKPTKAAEAFESLVSALIAAGVPAK